MLSTYFFIGGLSPFEFGSPAKSLRLQVCHIFCNPRSQPLCFISATEDVCLHSPKPLKHSTHKSIIPSHWACRNALVFFPSIKQKNVPNLRAFSRGRSRASSFFVITLHFPLRSTRSRLAPTGNISLRYQDFQYINHSSSIINNSEVCLPSHSCRHYYLFSW